MADLVDRLGVSENHNAIMDRISRLSSGQLDCLRLVHGHLSSKEIASKLKISPHTVDQRIRQSLKILGVERRAQAALLVAEHATQPYPPVTPQSAHPDGAFQWVDQHAALSIHVRHADRAGEGGVSRFLIKQRSASFRSFLQPPFATRNNPRNEMSVGQRLFWIAAIAMGTAMSAGMFLAGLESLGRLLDA